MLSKYTIDGITVLAASFYDAMRLVNPDAHARMLERHPPTTTRCVYAPVGVGR